MFKVIYDKYGVVADEKFCGHNCIYLKWNNTKHSYFCKDSKKYMKSKNEGFGTMSLQCRECLEKYKEER